MPAPTPRNNNRRASAAPPPGERHQRGGEPGQRTPRPGGHSTSRPPLTRCGARSRNISSACDDRGGIGRAAGQIDVDRKDAVESVAARIAALGDAARHGAGADGQHPARLRHRFIGRAQRAEHGVRHRPGHQQKIGKARRGGEEDAEPVQIVERIVQRLQLGLAAVARAGVDVADMQAAPERAASRPRRPRALSRRRLSRSGRRARAPRTPSRTRAHRPGRAGLGAELADDAAAVIDIEPAAPASAVRAW